MSGATLPGTIQAEGRDTARGDLQTRAGQLGGWCGLAFVASVVAQNALRSGAPDNDAPAREVARYVAGHQGVDDALFVLFALGAVALLVFAGTVSRSAFRVDAGSWARTGLLGVAGVAALFSLVVVGQLSLAVAVDRGAPLATVDTFWVLHNAAFTALLPMLAVALLGLSLASVASGIVAGWFRVVGPLGALALLVAALPAVSTTEGSAILGVGMVGFAVWLLFVASASVALLRGRA